MAETTTPGPNYYQRGSIQVWDFIRDQRLNFHLGNAIKYICRYGHKGNYDDQLSDLNKAIHYLENERNYLQWTRNRLEGEGLPGSALHFSDGTSQAVSGYIQDTQLEVPPGPYAAAELDYGGVQGVSGFNRDSISFEW